MDRKKSLEKIRGINQPGFRAVTLPIFYDVSKGGKGIEAAMQDLYRQAEKAAGKVSISLSFPIRGRLKKTVRQFQLCLLFPACTTSLSMPV